MWSYFEEFDILSIINAKRKGRIKKNLKAAGIKNYELFEFSSAKRITNIGPKDLTLSDLLVNGSCDETCQNILMNHMSLIQRAYDKGLNTVVILEDDALFDLPINNRKLKRVIKWLKSHRWDIFYFGYIPWPKIVSIPVTGDIVKTFNPLTAHCYALSRQGMKKILVHSHRRDIHIDKLFSDLDMKKYAILPAISFQDEDPGLYKRGLKKIGLGSFNIPFRKVSRVFEYIAIIIPIIIVFLVVFLVYWFIFSKS